MSRSNSSPSRATNGHLDRYIAIVIEGSEVFRFLERNQASLHSSGDAAAGKHRFAQLRPRVHALVEIITGSDASARSRIRATSALFSVSAACLFFMEDAAEPAPGPAAEAGALRPPERDELRKIVLEIADDLTHDIGQIGK
jgi:hypothetical protein